MSASSQRQSKAGEKVTTTVRLDADLHQEIRAHAREKDESFNAQVDAALRRYLKQAA